MVTVKKKKVGKQTYYYLEHSIRENSKVHKKQKYLGKKLPKNIKVLKERFIEYIRKEKWHKHLDKIKKEYNKERKKMPASAIEKEIKTFMIRFTYDTQKIEGSKLTLRETDNLLEKGITPKDKPIDDVKQAEAHKEIFYDMLKHKKDLSIQKTLEWHRKLLSTTKPDIAGKIREHRVAISGSKFMPPLPVEMYPLIKDFFKWYNKNKDKIHPVELAALIHLKFVTIHPFADGNGRISRLMMNFILNKHNFPMLNIKYEKRDSYYNALERSHIKKRDNIFLQWFIKRYIKENKDYLK